VVIIKNTYSANGRRLQHKLGGKRGEGSTIRFSGMRSEESGEQHRSAEDS
jgi:hypothetical protein